MHLIDINTERACGIEDGIWMQNVSIIFELEDGEKLLDEPHTKIPPGQRHRYDVALKEPICSEDLAKALELLANAVRNYG